MAYIFTLLLLVSLIALPIGLIKPNIIFRKNNVSRKKAGVILAGLAVLFFILTGLTAPSPNTKADLNSDTTPTISPSKAAISSPIPSHGGIMIKAVNVVDGDTIKIERGETVRYIGIDTPETVDPRKPIMCYGKEASDKNTELVEGKIVELEKDVSETDRYGRLLRYIWVDGVLINELLVREGYAQSSTYPPDVKYQNRFINAQRMAQQEQKGLWSSACTVLPTPKSAAKPTQGTTQPTENYSTPDGSNKLEGASGSYSCNCSKTCAQMSSCSEAQYQLNVCGCSARDADGDGIACDSDCQ